MWGRSRLKKNQKCSESTESEQKGIISLAFLHALQESRCQVYFDVLEL